MCSCVPVKATYADAGTLSHQSAGAHYTTMLLFTGLSLMQGPAGISICAWPALE